MSCAAPRSSDTACMARPMRVFLTKKVSAAMMIAPITSVKTVATLICTLPIVMLPNDGSETGRDFAP